MYIRVTKIIAEAMSLGGHLGGVGRGGARTKIDAVLMYEVFKKKC